VVCSDVCVVFSDALGRVERGKTADYTRSSKGRLSMQLTYDLQVEYMNSVIDTYHPIPRAHTSRLGVPPCPDIRRLLTLISEQ